MSDPIRIRVHGLLESSRMNGPGERAVVHLQGCTLACPACFNPLTHDPSRGAGRDPIELAAELAVMGSDGVSISGGEPFQQPAALRVLVRALRQQGVDSILIFSGYGLEELEQIPEGPDILAEIDLLIAGRYEAVRATLDPLLSSENQRLHILSERHEAAELGGSGANVEITIRPDGRITMTGFPPPALRRAVREAGEPVLDTD